jgi:hypothetical protein
VLLNHPLVVVGGNCGQALREQKVVGIATLHLDNLALLAEVLDIVDEEQFDATARTLGQTAASGFDERGFFGGHGSTPGTVRESSQRMKKWVVVICKAGL